MADDPLNAYLSEVTHLPSLTPNVEREALAKARQGDAHARKELLDGLLARTAEAALRLRPHWLRPLDAIQEANVALSRLVDDPTSKRPARELERRIAEHFDQVDPRG